MQQPRLIIVDKYAGPKNISPFVRGISCGKLPAGKDANYGRWISIDEIPTADANLCH
ncbi:hypothetical protein [Novosphingobium sp. EMRT-2]|uniref:hypothetical protein n=1 Tax=Novosphingobium sp. EMRT-2 TaxID=2571749 RepID=UPI00143CD54B|nr:hypothetical protein [Novosphingobium sp. EMRT-2]